MWEERRCNIVQSAPGAENYDWGEYCILGYYLLEYCISEYYILEYCIFVLLTRVLHFQYHLLKYYSFILHVLILKTTHICTQILSFEEIFYHALAIENLVRYEAYGVHDSFVNIVQNMIFVNISHANKFGEKVQIGYYCEYGVGCL